jgi:hypothetical protein
MGIASYAKPSFERAFLAYNTYTTDLPMTSGNQHKKLYNRDVDSCHSRPMNPPC